LYENKNTNPVCGPVGLIMTSCGKSDPIDTKATDAADDVALSEALYDDAFASLEIATVFAEVGRSQPQYLTAVRSLQSILPDRNSSRGIL
jgi:hypothetical protein